MFQKTQDTLDSQEEILNYSMTSIDLDKQKVTDESYKAHPLRFFSFFVFSAQNFFYGFLISTYIIIYQQLKIAYNYEYYQIQECVILVFIGKMIVVLFVTNIMEKFGNRNINILAVVLLVICCFLRYFVAKSFNYILASMLLAGMSGVFITSQQIKFSYNWFPIKERGIFISMILLAMPLGMSLGLIYPLLILNPDETSPQIIKQKIDQLDIQYIIIGCVLLLFTLFLKDKPPKGYGWLSEEGQQQAGTHPNELKSIFWRFKNLMKISQFRLYLIITSLRMNIMMIGSSVYTIIIQSLGYPHWLPGVLSIMLCFVSIMSSILYIKYFIDKKQSLYFTLFSLISMLFANMKILTLFLETSYIYYSFFDILENVFSGAVQGVLYELITRNIKADDFNFINAILVFISFGVTLIGQQIANFILRFIPNIDDSSYVIFLVTAILYYIYFYFCYLIKQLIQIYIQISLNLFLSLFYSLNDQYTSKKFFSIKIYTSI